MFKPRRQRGQQQPQNPVSDMEQFYLNQYFQTHGINPPTGPTLPPGASPNHHRFPPVEFAHLHQLEQRIARIEQYLGLFASTEPGFNSIER